MKWREVKVMQERIESIEPDVTGKVRDSYILAQADQRWIVASDRISAHDFVLPTPIPSKGRILTGMTEFWLNTLPEASPHHMVSTDLNDLPPDIVGEVTRGDLKWAEGRSMIVREADVFPIEAIVRGFITGSALKSYMDDGTVCGEKMPEGMVEFQVFPEQLFTPSTKAEQGFHDENISYARMVDIVGEGYASIIKERSLALYNSAKELAWSRGIILVDTKFEWGLVDGVVTLVDEVLTPDSSRYCLLEGYEPGRSQPSLDKQPIRDWLDANWEDKSFPPPPLPDEVVADTVDRYTRIFEMITGQNLAA